MSRAYSRPVIKKLHTSLLNKFGISASGRQHVRAAIDGVAIDDLVERYGSPLFVYSESAIRRRIRLFRDAFATRYRDVTLGWSYKTNYLKAICALMHEEGAWAEIVSRMEYEKARALGVAGDRIIFNGPHKPPATLRSAVAEGVTIHIDHLDEIDDLEQVAASLNRVVPVGMRVNLDAGIYPQWSRFGLNLESGQAMNAVRRIAHGGRLRLAGLHCHLGTYIMDPDAYRRQAAKLLEFAYQIEDRFGERMQFLDIGGGFPSRSKLRGTYLAPDVALPAIDEYAEAICGALHAGLRPGHFPKLILESGRALIDEAGALITSVVAAKRLADGTRAYVLDAGINLLYTAFWYKYTIETDRETAGMTEPSVLYGPLCMNIDCLEESVQLPPLERGQRLIVSPVGAYNNTQWQQFIEYRPNVVLVNQQGGVDLIREAEDLSDLDRRERLPHRMARRAAMHNGHAVSEAMNRG
jgi:diaminopimelate decarboxylase